jgi:hypothetical protein
MSDVFYIGDISRQKGSVILKKFEARGLEDWASTLPFGGKISAGFAIQH